MHASLLRSLVREILSESLSDDSAGSSENSARQHAAQLSSEIARHYGMTIVEVIANVESSFSDVYRVEPDDAAAYPTKTLAMKLSGKAQEYTAYAKIKEIRDLMLQSPDEGDRKAANYFPIIYVAEPLAKELTRTSGYKKYKCVIIMEPLRHFTGNMEDMTSIMSEYPTEYHKSMIAMLKDDDFMHRVITASDRLSPQESQKIENMIFTGANPTVSFAINPRFGKDEIDWIGLEVRKIFNPAYMIKDFNKNDPNYEEKAREFLQNVDLIQRQAKRIGHIYVDVLGEDRGVTEFRDMLHRIRASAPISQGVDKEQPYAQNTLTRPEEVVPGAAGFNDALVRLEKYGMSRRDLKRGNYMLRDDGHIVVSDPGMFKMKRT